MPETPSQINPEDFAYEKGDSTDVHNEEFQKELREAGQEENKEFELTPETEDRVMKKVQDINEYGVPLSKITVFSHNRTLTDLKNILKYGLLGRSGEQGLHRFEKTIDKWARDYHSTRNSINYFNIMGRFSEGMEQSEDGRFVLKEGANWNNNPYMRTGLDYINIGLIFELQRCIEDAPIDRGEEKKLPLGHYAMHGGGSWRRELGNLSPKQVMDAGLINEAPGEINKDGLPVNIDTSYGFIISKRITPREFQGLVISTSNKETLQYLISNCVREIAKLQMDTNSEKTERLIPIYDTAGNLLWPKQMSYEEVKQFVAERDAKKKEGEKLA